jgi:peptidoglycan/LPS O-acetylase OafA/YrhL
LSTRIPQLDSLRFIGFILVFTHHTALIETSGFVHQLKEIGWIGVDIFFALSAFLLTRNLIEEYNATKRIDRIQFLSRRARRILPLYIFYSCVMIMVATLILGHPFNWLRISGIYVFIDNLFTAFLGFNPIFLTGHLWSISYEVQCYIMLCVFLPVLFSKSREFKTVVIITLITLSIAIRYYLKSHDFSYTLSYTLPIPHVESFLAGILLAFRRKKLATSLYLLFTILSIVCLLILFNCDGRNNYVFIYTYSGIFSGWIVYTVIHYRNKILDVVFQSIAIRYLGKISYGLYIYHLIANKISLNLFNNQLEGNLMAIAGLSLLLTILLSILSFEFFERRFLKDYGVKKVYK